MLFANLGLMVCGPTEFCVTRSWPGDVPAQNPRVPTGPGLHLTTIPHLCLPLVYLDPRMVPKLGPQRRVNVHHAVRATYDVNVVQEGQEVFMGEQPLSCGRQCSVLTDCEKGRHERIALFSALTLDDFVDHTRIVLPNVRGCSTVKLRHEREN